MGFTIDPEPTVPESGNKIPESGNRSSEVRNLDPLLFQFCGSHGITAEDLAALEQLWEIPKSPAETTTVNRQTSSGVIQVEPEIVPDEDSDPLLFGFCGTDAISPEELAALQNLQERESTANNTSPKPNVKIKLDHKTSPKRLKVVRQH